MMSGMDRSKMCLAFVRTCHNGKVTARQFEIAKLNRVKYEKGKYHPAYGNQNRKGIKHTPETIAKIKERRKTQIFTKETRNKISLSNTGKLHTDEAKRKIGLSKSGLSLSNEHKQELSNAWHSEKRIKSMKNQKPRKTTPYSFNGIIYKSKKKCT